MKFCSAVLEEQRIRDWEGQKDGQTDGHKDHYIPPNFVCGGYNNSTISLLSSHGDRHSLSFEQICILSTKDALCQVWLKLAQWFWRRSQKCEKFTDGHKDDGQQVIRKAHLSFKLRCGKKRICTLNCASNTQTLKGIYLHPMVPQGI